MKTSLKISIGLLVVWYECVVFSCCLVGSALAGSVYDKAGSNVWCTSDLNTKTINSGSTGYLATLNGGEGAYLVTGGSELCYSMASTVSSAQWTGFYNTFGTSSLAASLTNIWTRTPDTSGATNAYEVNLAGVSSNAGLTSAAVTTEYDVLPIVVFNNTLTADDGVAGTLASPYVLSEPAGFTNLQTYLNTTPAYWYNSLTTDEKGFLMTSAWDLEAYDNTAQAGTELFGVQNPVSAVSATEWQDIKSKFYAVVGSWAPSSKNFWTRSVDNSNNNLAYYVDGTTGNLATVDYTQTKYAGTSLEYEYTALPAIKLATNVCNSGSATEYGTLSAPYTLTNSGCPTLTIINPTFGQIAAGDNSIFIYGTVTNPATSGSLVISATLAGITKSTAIALPAVNSFFSLSWNADDDALPLGIYGGLTTPIEVTATSNQSGSEVSSDLYLGRIEIHNPADRLTDDQLTQLAQLKYTINTRFAGALYFPTGTVPGYKQNSTITQATNIAAGYYCYDTNSDSSPDCEYLDAVGNYQIWYKTIGINEYPFVIQFYDQPTSGTDLRINDDSM